MKQAFSFRLDHVLKGSSRLLLIGTLLTVMLSIAAFAAAPAAHAAPTMNAIPAARSNQCVSTFPCVTIWATNVNVRSCASTNCSKVGTLAGGNERVVAFCQKQGQTVTADGITNNWWMNLVADNGNVGWSSNIFIVGGQKIANVPNC